MENRFVEMQSQESTLQDARLEKFIMTEKKKSHAEILQAETAAVNISHRVSPVMSNLSLDSVSRPPLRGMP